MEDPDVLSETGKVDSEEVDDNNTNVLCNVRKDITINNDKQEHKYTELLGLDPGETGAMLAGRDSEVKDSSTNNKVSDSVCKVDNLVF